MGIFGNVTLSANFASHGYCHLWDPGPTWLHVISDGLIALAYFSIPITLVYFVQERRGLPFQGIFLFFGLSIIACGSTQYVRKPVDFNQFSETTRQLGLDWWVLNQPAPARRI